MLTFEVTTNCAAERQYSPSLSLSRARIQIPIKKFNELRYNTALLLKEMEDIDGKQALKLLEI